ncbi:MAG TPA: DNA replication and repair protein RecF [Polyangiaceae bacterium]|jgi:DNA replication and repair protein RecF|nr:DNA replication and repair protein RecF [Polyangiaceae bacterium]
MRSLAVASLGIRDFRNLAKVDLDLGPGFNVLSGDNGQGKTNLLEAVYVLATSRSFRTARIDDLVTAGRETASLRGRVVDEGDEREQSIGLRRGLRAARIDGKRPPSLASYAIRTPVVVFHPGSLSLTSGGGTERRRLLDRIALYLGPASLEEAASYGRAMRARQRVLDTRGDAAPDLDGWEDLMVRHGSAMRRARAAAAALLVPATERAFARVGPELRLGIRYAPGAPDDDDAFRAQLADRRGRDRARGAATLGPHRDDLAIDLGDLGVRATASQGQHRAIVLSLELGEIDVIAETRGVCPVLLLDDVSSELDRARTAALLGALTEQRGQVILTTTRPELIDAGLSGVEDRKSFRVDLGAISPAA